MMLSSLSPLASKPLKLRVNVDNVTSPYDLGTITASQGAGLATFLPGPGRPDQLALSASF